jgi:hypothetical protein
MASELASDLPVVPEHSIPSMLGRYVSKAHSTPTTGSGFTTSQPGLDSSSARSLAQADDPKCTRAIRIVLNVSCTSEQKNARASHHDQLGYEPVHCYCFPGRFHVCSRGIDAQQTFADQNGSARAQPRIVSIACVLTCWGRFRSRARAISSIK